MSAAGWRRAAARGGSKESPKLRRQAVHIADLIRAGLLTAGQQLAFVHANIVAEAEVLPSGRLLLNGREHFSPSGAAKALTGRQAEKGWPQWVLADQPEVTLEGLRQQFNAATADA